MAEQVDQSIHVFDEEHGVVARERQRMYPEHRKCPPAYYDWARGPVCGCGTALVGSNPPLGGKGEQQDVRINDEDLVGVSAPAFLRDGTLMYIPDKGWFRFVGTSGARIGYWAAIDRPTTPPSWDIPQEAEPVKPHKCETQECADKPNFMDLNVSGSFSNMGAIPDTDDEHELAAGAYDDRSTVVQDLLEIPLPAGGLPQTIACRYIFGDEIHRATLTEWAEHFISKQNDYGDRANDLGLPGQYAELSRKFIKLRRAMWDGVELTSEPLREVLMDLIGHGFLSLMYVDNQHLTRYPKGKNT